MPNRFSSFAAVATATATVALATAVSAGAAAAHVAKLAPPVIKESFSPMPCSGSPGHRSTLQLEACAEQQILRSDTQIDGLNRKIFTALPSDSARRDLIAGHRAWLAYRKAYCLSVSDVFQGGTAAGVVGADCTASVNSQHVSNLKTFLKDLTSNG
ncbi:MAG: lysozyme inhibitor LprI family protein [Solirubrobacteraceae bacterium]